jgi:hypothetical protein
MARNRVIYQSEGLYVSEAANSTAAGKHFQLKRVQSANYNFNIARQDVNQYGELARIDSIVLESPTVALDFTYYLTDGENEKALGFYVTNSGGANLSQFPSGQLRDSSGVNFYIVTTDEGDDLNALTGVGAKLSGKSAIGIGNAYLTDYAVDLAVGSIPTVSVSLEGQNMNAFTFTSGAGGNSGSGVGINQTSGTSLGLGVILANPNSQKTGNSDAITALRPGDITLSFGGFTGSGIVSDLKELHVQSVSMSLPLGRTPIERLGSKFAFARVVDFPVTATLTVNGIQSDAATAKDLVTIVENNPKTDLSISIKKPGTNDIAVVYNFKQAQLDSAGISSSIGANKTADFTFSTQIGGANDTTNGIQMSGIHNGTVF